MKIPLRATLNPEFIPAVEKLSAESWMTFSQRWALSRTLKAVRQARKDLEKRRLEYIEANGKPEAEILIARHKLLKDDARLTEEAKRDTLIQIEKRLAYLIGTAADSKMISNDNPPAMKAFNEFQDKELDHEIDVFLDAPIKLPDECRLSGADIEAIDVLVCLVCR